MRKQYFQVREPVLQMQILGFYCGAPVTFLTNMDTERSDSPLANIEKPKQLIRGKIPGPGQTQSQRTRSLSLGSDTNKTPTKTTKVQLSKCPCSKSNVSSWKLKCSSCKQVWHTSCANLRTSQAMPENVVLNLEKAWTCPWCFRAPFLRPPGHPSCTNENQLMGTVIADAVCEQVRDDVINNILPEFQLSVDNLLKIRLKEISKAIETQTQSIKQDMDNLTALKEQLLTTDTASRHPSGLENPCSTVIGTAPALDENPTNYIEDYQESFLTATEITELNAALGAMSFSEVNGRSVASFGEEYQYTGAPTLNSKEIPAHLTAIINKLHDHSEYNDERINQVVVNKFTGKTHLPEHSDDEATIRPHSRIITVTLGQALPIVFRDKITEEQLTLTPIEGSLYAMSMESQHHWSHLLIGLRKQT